MTAPSSSGSFRPTGLLPHDNDTEGPVPEEEIKVPADVTHDPFAKGVPGTA
jgi:hypothetical protein